jgi:hypothetical protein
MTIKHFIVDEGYWDSIDSLHDHERFPGIYRLHATDTKGEFVPLSRLLGIDPEGILYIGASAVVQDRASELKKSICAAYKKIDPVTYKNQKYSDFECHQTGKKIVRRPRFVENFPLSRLCLTVTRHLGNPDELEIKSHGHFKLEEKLLQEYEQKFGEKPAFNS